MDTEKSKNPKQSKHGGTRPGAGRPRGSKTRFKRINPRDRVFRPAIIDAPPFKLIGAAIVLGIGLDEVRGILGLTREEFQAAYGHTCLDLTQRLATSCRW